MTGRLDPPHDRVTLTPSERRMVAQLEQAYDDQTMSPDRIDTQKQPRRVRGWAPRACRYFMRIVPWLLPLGLFIVVAFSYSGVACAVGALLGGVAVVASVLGSPLRTPLRRLRRRRFR